MKCNPPVDLAVHGIADRQVTMTWNAPEGGTGCPDPQWIHWDDGTNFTSIGWGCQCNYDIAARWDAEQIVVLDGGAVTKIAFYPAGIGTANYRIRVWQGQDAATLLVDQAVPSVTHDEWNIIDVVSPVSIDITQELWIGCNVDALSGFPSGCDAGPAIVGYGDMMYYQPVGWHSLKTVYGVDYNWNVQGYIEKDADYPTDVRTLLDYNLYRSDNNKITWNKLNAALIADTNYTDHVPDYQDYCYYVTSVFSTYGSMTCESDSSNVVCADIITGIDPLNSGRISIYPNPATDNVFVQSDFTITGIEVLNYTGQTVYTRQKLNEKTINVNVVDLTTGVYFVKVTAVEGIKTVKITVTR
jgi:Secretion system C-terminal sorting domain